MFEDVKIPMKEGALARYRGTRALMWPEQMYSCGLASLDLFGNMSTYAQYSQTKKGTLWVSQFFEGDSCKQFQGFR